MRALLDANILISALQFGGNPLIALDAVNCGSVLGFTSSIAMQEVESILLRKFKSGPADWQVISLILRESLTIIPTPHPRKVDGLRDIRDSHILEAALLCKADYIVTGDKDLLVLTEYKGIEILSAGSFAKLLG